MDLTALHHSACVFRQATPQDIHAVVALDRAIESSPHWPIAAYAAMVCQAKASVQRCLIVAELPGAEPADAFPRLVGFAVASHHAPAAELESVGVAPAARRSGLGRSLSATVIAWGRERGATEVTLEVRAANAAAIALYIQLGFREIAQRARYYSAPEDDAILMRLTL